MILLSASVPRSTVLLCLVLAATNSVATKSQLTQELSSEDPPSGLSDTEVEEEEEDLFEQALVESEHSKEVNKNPYKGEREPCDGVFISDKGNRYSDCGPWRLKKRAPPPPKGSWPGFGLVDVDVAAVPGVPKRDADWLGWIWVFGAWEDKLFKMVAVDQEGKKIECRYTTRKEINETFMPDLLTADELQPYWDIAVREGEDPKDRADYHPPPGSYSVEVDIFCKKDTHHCDESMSGRGNEGYRGCQSFTRYGEPCMKWTDQSPTTHNNTPELRPGKGLGEHNFCRNPDGMQTIWCYIAKENRAADRRRACKKNPTKHTGALWEWCQPLAVYRDPDQSTTTTTTVCQPLGDFKVKMIKKDHACWARERMFLGKMSRQRCAEAVRANGYKFFHWIKWCATGNCGAVGTKSAECREGWRYSTKFDFYAIEEFDHHKQAYAKHGLVKEGHKCKSGEMFLGWMSSVPACANAVKSDGGKFFSYGKHGGISFDASKFSAGSCYKEDTNSKSCPEGWEKDGKFDFYALDDTGEVASHQGAECFHSQCCHSEGSAPCTWCGGEDWYCCHHLKKYPSDDPCANVDFGGKAHKWKRSTEQHRCAKLKSSVKPGPRSPKTTEPPTAATTSAPTPAPKPGPRPPKAPTQQPTTAPTPAPTTAPTPASTTAPTQQPTTAPTPAPTPAPTQQRRRRRGKGKGSRRRRGKNGKSRRRRGSKSGKSRRRRGSRKARRRRRKARKNA